LYFTTSGNYIAIDGFEIQGNNLVYGNPPSGAPTDSLVSNCCQSGDYPNNAHHIMFLNNHMHNSVGGGLQTIGGDYFLVAGNEIHHTTLCSPYGSSGLSIFHPIGRTPNSGQPWDTQTYHIQVLDNLIYDNGLDQSAGGTCHANNDGNGMIMDDWQHQQDGQPSYQYHGLLLGNMSYSNRGSGIRVFNSVNVDVYNNTTWNNGLNQICDSSQGGCPAPSHNEILFSGQNNNFVNNILYAYAGSLAFQQTSAYGKPDTGNTLKNTDTFITGSPGANGILVSGSTNDSGYTASYVAGANNNKLGVDPKLNNPAGLDFHLTSGSPAIAAGASLSFSSGLLPSTPTTFEGTPFANPPDLGAFAAAVTTNSVPGP
jgi:hypothetical protein